MNNTRKFMTLVFCITTLSSCLYYEENRSSGYETYSYVENQINTHDESQTNNYGHQNQLNQEVSVPDSYHVGAFHSPVSFKDVDRSWINNRNPQEYTIEVADAEKASQVAQILLKAPKNDRMAQVKYQRNGKVYYKGLYGSYENSQAAQKALDALPPEIKEGSGVKNWGSVQNSIKGSN